MKSRLWRHIDRLTDAARSGSAQPVAARQVTTPLRLLRLGAPLIWPICVLAILFLLATETSRGASIAGLVVGGVMGVLLCVTLLGRRTENVAEPEPSRFDALGERVERGIERLKDLQWELSDSEVRYRELLDSQSDIISRADREGRLIYVNRSFCQTFGLEPGAILGKPLELQLVSERRDDLQPSPEPGRRRTFELEVMTVLGPRWFAFEEHAIADASGATKAVQRNGRDVTEQRRTLAALGEARDQAEAANRAKSRFLAAMSHEIRTPMNGILGMTGLLAETPLSAEQKSYVGAVQHSAKTLLTIIDEILDLSKIEAGKLEIHSAPFQLVDCVQGAVELMGPRAREKSLDLAWMIEPDLPKQVVGDETRVRQILLNLIGNAVKFTDKGGVAIRVKRSTVAAMPEGAGSGAEAAAHVAVAIEVADTGVGMAAEQLSTLFGEFAQADEVINRKRSGTGLGLAISRRLARAMQGDIGVESRLGQGSTFKAHVVLEVGAGGTCALSAPAGLADRHVLIVGDRAMQQAVMRDTLEALGIAAEAVTASEASEALRRASETRKAFDAVIVDAELGAAGIARLLAIGRHQEKSGLRALLVCDQAGKQRLEEFRTAGCDAYLVRPVRPASLISQLSWDFDEAQRNANAGATAKAGRTGTRTAQPVTRHLLLVEDNAINALLARRMSERAGCSVHHAPSGEAAVAYCEEMLAAGGADIDVVLMDIHMPGMDGLETTRRLKALFGSAEVAAPPIVALTANAFAEDRKRCFEAGLDDYLAKPFDRAELEVMLEKWCPRGGATHDGRLGEAAA